MVWQSGQWQQTLLFFHTRLSCCSEARDWSMRLCWRFAKGKLISCHNPEADAYTGSNNQVRFYWCIKVLVLNPSKSHIHHTFSSYYHPVYVSGGFQKQQKHNTKRSCEYMIKHMQSDREQKQQFERETDERGIFLITLGCWQECGFGILNWALLLLNNSLYSRGALHLQAQASGAQDQINTTYSC